MLFVRIHSTVVIVLTVSMLLSGCTDKAVRRAEFEKRQAELEALKAEQAEQKAEREAQRAAAEEARRQRLAMIDVQKVGIVEEDGKWMLHIEFVNKTGKEIGRIMGGLSVRDGSGDILYVTGYTREIVRPDQITVAGFGWADGAKIDDRLFRNLPADEKVKAGILAAGDSLQFIFEPSELRYTDGTVFSIE